MLPRYNFSWFGFRLTCARFARILFRGGYVHRKSILEDIIIHFDLITKLLDPREKYWPIGRINKRILVDQSLNHLEVFCNISRGILKQETQQSQSVSSQNLVHNGSVFLYFFSGMGGTKFVIYWAYGSKRLFSLVSISFQAMFMLFTPFY